MLSRTIFVLTLLLSTQAQAFDQSLPPDPRHAFRVTGVASDDALNVRSSPSVGADIVGTLSPDTTDVTITGVRQRASESEWWEIVFLNTDNNVGWVNARFLEQAGREIQDARGNTHSQNAAPETEFPLACVGTEPFWGLRIADGEAAFSRLGETGIEQEIWTASSWIGATGLSPGWAFGVWLGNKPDRGWAAVQRSFGHCSDGMSDNDYPYSVMIITPEGAPLGGCCRRAQ